MSFDIELLKRSPKHFRAYFESSCTDKQRHKKRSDATRIAGYVHGTQEYHCPFCGFWHIGHPPKGSL